MTWVVNSEVERLRFCLNKDVPYNNPCCLIFIDVNGDALYTVKIVRRIVMEFAILELSNVFPLCTLFATLFTYIRHTHRRR